jgi:Tfp pilus assembly protein PilW
MRQMRLNMARVINYLKPPKGFASLKRISSLRGLTLVEALVTVLIFSIILGATYTVLISGSDSWEVNNVRVELQQELRKAMDWMSQELREAGSASITNVLANGTWYTTITFRTATGVTGGTIDWSTDTIQYVLGGADANQLQRIKAGDPTKIVALNIQSLQFRRQASSSDIVEVALQARKSTPKGNQLNVNSDFKIQLRN